MKIPRILPRMLPVLATVWWVHSARAQQVIFSEAMYNPPADLPEFIEVLNNTATPYDIASWVLGGGVSYQFPNFDSRTAELTFLKAFERILISSVPEEALREAYPDIPRETRVFGPWDGLADDGVRSWGRLANGGERIVLKNKNDSLICSFSFDDDPALWPVAADGAGHSLQVVDPNRKIDDWRNWRASTFRGGSPGRADPERGPASFSLSEVFFNEEGKLLWVELHNAGRTATDLRDLRFVVPETVTGEDGQPIDATHELALGGQVAPGGYATAEANFEIEDLDDVRLLLLDADDNVISAHRIRDAESNASYQTYPAGSGEWYVSDAASKGTANDPARHDDIVINEIMYSHPVGKIGEFIELYNRGDSTVDLSGWEITEGVGFAFPTGTTLAPRSYLVIAADAIWFQENYEYAGTLLGDFEGSLSNRGETIRIVDARENLVDQVDYSAGGEWPENADGLGSSLELVHPDMDNNLGSAWRDSDESEKSELREYSATMRYDSRGVWHPSNDDELHLHLVGEGYILLKDINFSKPRGLFNPNARNLLENADRESTNSRSNSGWVFQGNHAFGSYRNGEIHLVATGRGDNRANRVEIDMEDLGTSTDAELRFQARWLYGKPRLIAQTADHAWSYEFLIDVPTNLGTPGDSNSVAAETARPQIDGLSHHPAVPTESEDVTVSAKVSAANGLEKVEVAYIDDSPGGNEESLFRTWKRRPMKDDGSGGDALAGDGIYSGKIMDMKDDGRIVAFFIEATSNGGEIYQYPHGGSEKPAFYVVDSPATNFELRTVRAVVGQKDLGAISNGLSSGYDGKFPRASNHYWNSTIIYNESEIFYNATIRSAGSPWHTGDRGNLKNKGKWKLPKSKAWRGQIKTTYDQDPTSSRAHNDRVIRYWLYLLGHKINDNEFIKFTVNSSNFVTREEVEAPGTSEFMNRLWEGGNQGHMYRVDDEWDFGDNIDSQRNNRNADWNYKSPNGHRAGRYHSEYMLRSRETEYDFTGLINSFRLITGSGYTQEEAARYFDIEMIALNAAARGYIHDWDFQTLNRGKNTFYYQRPDGLFQYVHWDSDLAFRTGDLGAAFATGQGSSLRNFLRKPWFQRWFKFYLHELSENFVDKSARFETWLDLENNSTRDQRCDVNRYINWGKGRRAAVNRELGNARSAPFVITTNGGRNFSTTEDMITLEGTSAVDAYEVFVEDHPEAEIHWTGTIEYELRGVVLREGENVLTVRAKDMDGNVLGSLFSPKKDSITVSKTSPSRPVAVFDFQPASLNLSLGQSLAIDASASWDPEGDALSFAFEAPAGAAIAADGAVAEVTFDKPGFYPLTITITDADGNAAEVVREVSVFGGSQGFDSFSNRRIAGYWQEENIAAQTTTFQFNFYTAGDPEGMLSFVVLPDEAKPLAAGNYPVIQRDLPAADDFSLQAKLILANLQFGPFHTGVFVEMTDGQAHVSDDPSRRYVFGIKGGTALTVSEVSGSTVTDLASIDRNVGRATVRIRRMSGQLYFDYRESKRWRTLHTLTLSEDLIKTTRGGLFAATDEAVGMRVLFDYAMLVDTGQVSDLQRDLRLTEVMYNPAGGQELEFLEMQSVGAGTLDLRGAHFTDGIEYTFERVLLSPGQYLILAKDPNAFAGHYDAKGAQVIGGYNGRLNNRGETIELVDANERLIFSFTYDDIEPWPAEADGQGNSLEVIDATASVNSSANWRASAAATGSPGAGGEIVDPEPADADGDGIPTAWERQHGLNPNDGADGSADNDHDGTSNFQEYVANTDPTDGTSFLSLEVSRSADSATIRFPAQADRRYAIEFTDDLTLAQWETLEAIPPSEEAAPVSRFDVTVANSGARYYRVRVSLP